MFIAEVAQISSRHAFDTREGEDALPTAGQEASATKMRSEMMQLFIGARVGRTRALAFQRTTNEIP
jgi:hypothetical protein